MFDIKERVSEIVQLMNFKSVICHGDILFWHGFNFKKITLTGDEICFIVDLTTALNKDSKIIDALIDCGGSEEPESKKEPDDASIIPYLNWLRDIAALHQFGCSDSFTSEDELYDKLIKPIFFKFYRVNYKPQKLERLTSSIIESKALYLISDNLKIYKHFELDDASLIRFVEAAENTGRNYLILTFSSLPDFKLNRKPISISSSVNAFASEKIARYLALKGR